MLIICLYISVGALVALGALAVPELRRHIGIVAGRLGLSRRYAFVLWILGTIMAWPVGLYVLLTGRLVWAPSHYQAGHKHNTGQTVGPFRAGPTLKEGINPQQQRV